jgi:hypothetical protein
MILAKKIHSFALAHWLAQTHLAVVESRQSSVATAQKEHTYVIDMFL